MSSGKVTPARSRGGRRRTGGKSYDVRTAKKLALEYIGAGLTVAGAAERVGRSVKTYEYWRRNDPEFRRAADAAMATRKVTDGSREGNRERAREMGFAAWRKQYLEMPTYRHQQQWVDLIEGRQPEGLHEAQTYEPGRRNRIIVNTPPNHAKSVTLTMDYVTYRICCDPNVRIKIISAAQSMATQFLGGVKFRLTHPNFAKLQADFAPEGGYKATADSWKQNLIFIGQERDSGEKDPTVEALGIGGQIYGARADLIILDDCVDLGNVNQWQKQMNWISQEVDSRLGPPGKLIVVGTRVAPVDLYKELRNGDNFSSGRSPWTYLSQPAIFVESGSTDEMETLWPRATDSWGEECDCGDGRCLDGFEELNEDGEQEYPHWDGLHITRLRDNWDSRRFALVYQQTEIDEYATFPSYAVNASINNRRRGGLDGGLDSVPENTYWIGAVDPATTGNAGAIVYAVDRASHRRYVVDAVNLKGPTPARLKSQIKNWSTEYPIKEWRIEKTGLLTMFTQDQELRSWLSARGIRFVPHYTSCIQEDALALTRQGWRSYREIAAGEEILTADGWESVQAVNVYDAPEKVYRVDTHHVAGDFTANHRHLVEWRGKSAREQRFVETEDLKGNTPIVLTPEVQGGRGVGLDLAAILGWYITEGSERKYGAHICQSRSANPAKWREIKGHLDSLGWEYSEYDNGQGVTQFYIKSGSAVTLKELAPAKELSRSVLTDMTDAEREAFVRACLLGDGHGETFFSSSPHNIEAFEMACLLNGKVTRRFELKHNSQFNCNNPLWGVRRKAQKRAFTVMTGRDYREPIEGQGKVWCPTVPSGTWVVRSRGRTFVTGNSNKWDYEFGVSSMSTLFGSWDRDGDGEWKPIHDPIIELPRVESDGLKALVHQLVTWSPELDPKKVACDLVMSMWFAEIAAREVVKSGDRFTRNFAKSKFHSPRQLAKQQVVDLAEIRHAKVV